MFVRRVCVSACVYALRSDGQNGNRVWSDKRFCSYILNLYPKLCQMASGSASFISSIEDTVLLLLMTLSVCVYIFIYNKEEFCTLVCSIIVFSSRNNRCGADEWLLIMSKLRLKAAIVCEWEDNISSLIKSSYQVDFQMLKKTTFSEMLYHLDNCNLRNSNIYRWP